MKHESLNHFVHDTFDCITDHKEEKESWGKYQKLYSEPPVKFYFSRIVTLKVILHLLILFDSSSSSSLGNWKDCEEIIFFLLSKAAQAALTVLTQGKLLTGNIPEEDVFLSLNVTI